MVLVRSVVEIEREPGIDAVERREAPGPTSLGSRASKAAGLGNQALP